MRKKYVADTHALFWYLIGSTRLGTDAKDVFDEGVKGNAIIFVPAIVIAELYFLNQKLGKPLDFTDVLNNLRSNSQFSFVSFKAIEALDFETDNAVPEMHDRIIVGVARRKKAACLTIDTKIVSSGLVKVVW